MRKKQAKKRARPRLPSPAQITLDLVRSIHTALIETNQRLRNIESGMDQLRFGRPNWPTTDSDRSPPPYILPHCPPVNPHDRCGLCGISHENMTGYCCPRIDCPSRIQITCGVAEKRVDAICAANDLAGRIGDQLKASYVGRQNAPAQEPCCDVKVNHAPFNQTRIE